MIEYEISRLKTPEVIETKRSLPKTPTVFILLFLYVFPVPVQAKQLDKRSHHQQQRLLIISLDGFRHDFIELYNLKHFSKFVAESSKAAYLNPQFTTQAFPNHWSIVTGSYVESHGIVANKFYDPVYNEYFQESSKELKWWNRTEPFWFTSVRKGLKTGVYHWPGSETVFYHDDDHERNDAIDQLYTFIPYNENTPLTAKINQSLKWLLHDDYKLVCIYHNQPDAIAHKYGLNSREFNVTLSQLDETFGSLVEQLKTSGLDSSPDFNLIVLSDHGLSSVKKNIFVSDYFDENDAQIWSFNRNLIHLRPLISLDSLLVKISKIPGITVTLKNRMPDRLHYKTNRRIGEIIISALEGVGFIYMGREPMQFNGKASPILLTHEQKKKLLLAIADKASHGYDKIYPNMRGVFIARGAMFKSGFRSGTAVENVDVYPLVCHVLSIECESRNGSLENVRHFFKLEYQGAPDSDELRFNIFNCANRNRFFNVQISFFIFFLLEINRF